MKRYHCERESRVSRPSSLPTTLYCQMFWTQRDLTILEIGDIWPTALEGQVNWSTKTAKAPVSKNLSVNVFWGHCDPYMYSQNDIFSDSRLQQAVRWITWSHDPNISVLQAAIILLYYRWKQLGRIWKVAEKVNFYVISWNGIADTKIQIFCGHSNLILPTSLGINITRNKNIRNMS